MTVATQQRTEETYTAIYRSAHTTFHQMLIVAMAEIDQEQESTTARRLGVMEAAAIIEKLQERAKATGSTPQEVLALLDTIYGEVISLIAESDI